MCPLLPALWSQAPWVGNWKCPAGTDRHPGKAGVPGSCGLRPRPAQGACGASLSLSLSLAL